MSEPNKVEVARRVVQTRSDGLTRALLWGVGFLLLTTVAVIAYALATGVFGNQVPQTAEEYRLVTTAAAIAADPTNGVAYATRAETLYKLGRVNDAFEVLDQGEQAIGDSAPNILFLLRTRMMLLNQEERFAEAEELGVRAMELNNDYVARQIEANTAKGIVSGIATIDQRAGVAIALQNAAALTAQEKWEDALPYYNYALAWQPSAADIMTLRGWAYVEMGAEASATIDFNQALEFLPDDPSALAGLAQVESNQ
jgi:tetratricopeptide (TPR) repeat protein